LGGSTAPRPAQRQVLSGPRWGFAYADESAAAGPLEGSPSRARVRSMPLPGRCGQAKANGVRTANPPVWARVPTTSEDKRREPSETRKVSDWTSERLGSLNSEEGRDPFPVCLPHSRPTIRCPFLH
jgi:hypothetical protein